MANKLRSLLATRTAIYTKIRTFFAERGVLEVDTPLLLAGANPAPYLENFAIEGWYLQTSPEIAMKQLLAAGSGDIYQLGKAFRKNETGKLHHHEFSMLEWYRLDFDHHQLMQEVDELLKYLLATPSAKYYTYQEVCESWLGINPHRTNVQELQQLAKQHDLLVDNLPDNLEVWLPLLFTLLVEPKLTVEVPVFIYDFPISQAMLARRRWQGEEELASRFELYYRGVELANGFHELNDPQEQLKRFNDDLQTRKVLGLPEITLPHEFIHSLAQLPNCAGVALGIDRLIMLATQSNSLSEILPIMA